MGAKTDISSVMSDLFCMLGKCLCPALKSKGVEIALPVSRCWIWQPQGGACRSSLPLNHASRCLAPRDSPPCPPGLVSRLPAGLAWSSLVLARASHLTAHPYHALCWHHGRTGLPLRSTSGTQPCHTRVSTAQRSSTPVKIPRYGV